MNNVKFRFILFFFCSFLSFVIVFILSRLVESYILNIVAIVFLSILINLLYNYNFKKSLSRLKKIVNRINKNDLIFDTREEEFGLDQELMTDISKMLEELKENFKQQVNISTEIAEISDRLINISKESKEAMNTVEASIEAVSQDSEAQTMKLQEISENLAHIVGNVKQMSDEVNKTVEFTEQSILSTQEGIQATKEIYLKMQKTKELTVSTNKEVNALREQSKEIVKLVEKINNISEEINMLSLNASIEAARAGELGKGFGVVAQEVGKLAGETSKVSKEIEVLAYNFQNDIHGISKSMEEDARSFEEGYSLVEDTIEKFNRINENLQISIDKVKKAEMKFEDLSSINIQIASSIEEITDFSQQISTEMQEAASQTTLQNEKASEIQNIIEELTKSADYMQQYVTSKVMEGKMLRDVTLIKNELENKNITDEMINKLINETGVDTIYISDEKGIVTYCNDKDSIGLDLYAIDSSYIPLKERKISYVTTPVKKRVEDGKLFKFLAILDDKGCIYQVGLSIESLLNF